MSERLRQLTDEELGRALAALGRELAVPDTPPVVDGVLARIREERRHPAAIQPRLGMPSRRRAIALLVAAVLLVAAAAVAAELLIRLGGVTIEIVPSATVAPPDAVAGGDAFGRPVGLAEAEARAGFAAAVPSELGAPDDVWVGRARAGFEPDVRTARIVMAWRPREDLPRIRRLEWAAVLMQLEADVDVAVKTVAADTASVASVLVDGQPAFWVTGAHTLELSTPTGRVGLLVTGNVLLWERGPHTLRLETDVSIDRAVAIAASID